MPTFLVAERRDIIERPYEVTTTYIDLLHNKAIE